MRQRQERAADNNIYRDENESAPRRVRREDHIDHVMQDITARPNHT